MKMNYLNEIQFNLFVLYFRYKLNKLMESNQNNLQITMFLHGISLRCNDSTPQRIINLEKRFLK